MAEVKGKDVTDSLPKNDSKIEKQDGKNDNKDSKNKKPWDYAVSATMSGILTKSACAPFDRIRLLYQVQGMFGNPTVDAVKYKSISHTAKTILREEGFVGFWRGNGTNMLRASVVYAMKFGTNDWMKERMLRKKKKRSARFEERMAKRLEQVSGVPEEVRKPVVQLGVFGLMKAGLVAGFVQKVVSYPLDFLSVRIALGVNTSTLNEGLKSYDSIWSAVKRIHSTEGVRGFYKGFGPTLLTGVPYVMLQMTFFELYKRKLLGTNGAEEQPKNGSLMTVFVTSSLAGSLAGVTAQTLVFPGDTVRKRMMSNGVDGRTRLYKNSIDCFNKIHQREGVRAFYHGVLPMCLRAVPSGAIQFGTYELFKSLFGYMRSPRNED